MYGGRPLAFVEQSMLDWLVRGGAIPSMLGPVDPSIDRSIYAELLQPFDALILQGGVDVSPTWYGETPRSPEWAGDRARDEYEFALFRAAVAANKPVLGICRGHQLINVALGGSLFQDITTDHPNALQHRNAALYQRNQHDVSFVPGGMLHRIYETHHAVINSVHHQGIKQLAPGLEVLARAPDDVIESVMLPVESSQDPWVLGVQWHPEFQTPDDRLLPTQPLLDALFDAIKRRSATD